MAVSFYIFDSYSVIAKDDKSLYDIVQLAYIACPRARGEKLYSLGVYRLCCDVVARTYLLNKVFG
jgi:hypothetical protein